MSEKQTPLVSVVCLCYNHEGTVSQALESVLAQQTDFPFEVIVHDDASADGTPDIIRAFAQKYPDTVVPVLQTENQLHRCNIAQTFIAPLLRGRYVAICEGDDYWTDPGKLAAQVRVMEADPEIALCFHAVEEHGSDGTVRAFRPVKRDGEVPAGLVIRRGGMFCPSVSLLVRRDIADLWPAFRAAADVYDYPLQALAAAEGKVYYLDRSMGAYRFQQGESWTAQRALTTDWEHLKNETRWLGMFNDYTGGRFTGDIDYHLTHLWFTEYRKSPQKELRLKVCENAKKLNPRDRAVFSALTLLYAALGKRADRIYLTVKKRLLK